MARFANAAWQWAICDKCGLRDLARNLVLEPVTSLRVHPDFRCLDQKDPYLLPPRPPDAVAVRWARPDRNITQQDNYMWGGDYARWDDGATWT